MQHLLFMRLAIFLQPKVVILHFATGFHLCIYNLPTYLSFRRNRSESNLNLWIYILWEGSVLLVDVLFLTIVLMGKN